MALARGYAMALARGYAMALARGYAMALARGYAMALARGYAMALARGYAMARHQPALVCFLFGFCFTLFEITSKSFATLRHLHFFVWRDSVLKEIIPTGNYRLYFPQNLLKIASDFNINHGTL